MGVDNHETGGRLQAGQEGCHLAVGQPYNWQIRFLPFGQREFRGLLRHSFVEDHVVVGAVLSGMAGKIEEHHQAGAGRFGFLLDPGQGLADVSNRAVTHPFNLKIQFGERLGGDLAVRMAKVQVPKSPGNIHLKRQEQTGSSRLPPGLRWLPKARR